ncbi:MAG: CSLREA domain-containing protein [Acidobacteriota bacterium]|nr:CSLREA domain-containing protein [Acidobacteriota bacterium]
MPSIRAFYLLVLTLSILIFFAADAKAQVLTVTKTADTNDGVCDVDCSLREAIAAAASGDVVQFATPPFNSPQTITLTLGELTINRSLTILGSGAHLLTIGAGSGSVMPQGRVFLISGSGITVKLSGMAVFGGRAQANAFDRGGGILNEGATVFLTNLHIYSNLAGVGGGVYNSGTMHILDSTVSGNIAMLETEGGGGIGNGGTLTLTNTTVSGNSGSLASNILNSSSITLTNATIGPSLSGTSPVILNKQNTTMIIRNTIVAGNISSSSNTMFTSQGNNLVANASGTPTGWVASDLLNVNPLLSPLTNNGGQTPTHALQAGSPAINGGNNSLAINPVSNQLLQLDQRLYNRIVGGTVDIGAFESNSSPSGAVIVAGRIITNANNRGVPGALAVLRFVETGEIRYGKTNPFGYFYFNGIPMGSTVIITIMHKYYRTTPLIITATGEVHYLGLNAKTDEDAPTFFTESKIKY